MTALGAPAQAALGWAERHLGEFAIRGQARDDHEAVLLLKPLSEVALTAALLGRDPALRARCHRLVEWAWEQVDRGDYLLRITSARPELVESVGLYACAHGFGHHDDRLHAWFGHLAASAVTEGLELPPWRRTALRYNLARLGLAEPPREAAPGGWLATLAEPWTISDTTGYPLTHEVFYLTDFGVRPERLTPDIVAYLTQWLPAWLRCAHNSGNHDLAAELVMVGACAGVPPADDALIDILAHRRPDGRIAGPRGAGGNLPCPEDDPQRRDFLRDYHTTLVTLLALTADLWAGCGRAPGSDPHDPYDRAPERTVRT